MSPTAAASAESRLRAPLEVHRNTESSTSFGGAADAVTSLAMDGKENHGGVEHAQYEARESHKAGLAQRSQNQLNQNHAQRRGRAPGKSRRGYHNQKRHGVWPAGPQRQIAWPRNTRTHPQGVHWFQAPNANTPYMNQHVMQPHRFPPQPATPSYVADTSMRYVYATPGTQLATEISAMVSCLCRFRCHHFYRCSLTTSVWWQAMHTPWGNWRTEMLLETGTGSAERRDNGDGLAEDDDRWDARIVAKRSHIEPARSSDGVDRTTTPRRDAVSNAPQAEEYTEQVPLSPESTVMNERLLESMVRTDELLT